MKFLIIIMMATFMSACSENNQDKRNSQSNASEFSIGDEYYWDTLKLLKSKSAFLCVNPDRETHSCCEIIVPTIIDNQHGVLEMIGLIDKSEVYGKLVIPIKVDITVDGVCYTLDEYTANNLKIYYSNNKRPDFSGDENIGDSYNPFFTRASAIRSLKNLPSYKKRLCQKLFLNNGQPVLSLDELNKDISQHSGSFIVKTFYNDVVQKESTMSYLGTGKDNYWKELRGAN